MFICPKDICVVDHSLHDELTEENASKFFRVLDIPTEKSFVRNYGGHPRSDIAVINEQTDLSVAANLVERLSVQPQSGDPNASIDDVLLTMKSKYCQTPSEMIDYYDRILKERDDRALAKLEGEEKEKVAADLAAKRKLLYDSLTNEEKEALRNKKRAKEVESLIDF